MHIAVCSYKPTSCPRALTVARIHNSVYPDNPTSMPRSSAPPGIHNVALSSFISSQNLLNHTKNKSVKHPEQTVAPNSSLKHAAGKKEYCTNTKYCSLFAKKNGTHDAGQVISFRTSGEVN
jgi:hypothetical protein